MTSIKRTGIKFTKVKGFTLVEMITVIVLLGILSIGISGFIKLGTQVYVDVSNRDELISSARYGVERLNRELRIALPNSARTISNILQQCIEFYPTLTSVVYLDIPVSPELPSSTLTFAFEENAPFPNLTNAKAVVYPLFADELYGNSSKRIYDIASVASVTPSADNIRQMTLTSSETFAEESPTKRLFVVGQPIQYCVQRTGELWRYQAGGRVLMAEHLTIQNTPKAFTVNDATLYRNSSILIKLTFSRFDEVITFNNEVQVRNVP
jgi:MSHA biogenesis protein MshO